MKLAQRHSFRRALPGPCRWGLALGAALAAGALLAYYWRVFYYLDARGVPGLPFTLLVCLLAAAVILAVWAVRRLRTVPAQAAACIFLCGLVFAAADPPLQAPDETQHYLRAYAISQGHLDFDASRTYPADVSSLVQAFPGAWVNGHTSAGVVEQEGEETAYDTTGYALKQYGEDGPVQSIAQGFAQYLAGEGAGQTTTEPILFMVLPFLPQALGMALARLLGFGALGCLYGGRVANLVCYSLLCLAALKNCGRARPLFCAAMLLPLSLYMGASLSYDATLLGCYYLMASFLAKERFTRRDAAAFVAALVWVNMAKPWINLLWLALPLLLERERWQAGLKKWQLALAGLAASLAVTGLVSWYGTAFRSNYGQIGRMLDDVAQLPQLQFILSNPLRFAAVLAGTLYENDLFLGQLGLFGSLDLPVPLLNLTGGLVLALGAFLSLEQGAARRGLGLRLGVGGWCLVYLAGAMTAMYITYTPVGMIRIIGLQARYFLPVFLLLFWLAAQGLSAVAMPRQSPEGAVQTRVHRVALALFAGYALVGGLLLFQHYFLGPVYTIG